MSEATQEKKAVRRDPDIYRVDTFVRVVNQAQREREFESLFGGIIRKAKRIVKITVDVLTILFSLLGLGTAIWFIATVLM